MSACSVFVYDGDTPLDLTKAVIGLEWGDMKGELAARAVLRMNARMGGAELAEYARLNAPISILAYGREVFSGVIWDYSLIDGRTLAVSGFEFDWSADGVNVSFELTGAGGCQSSLSVGLDDSGV